MVEGGNRGRARLMEELGVHELFPRGTTLSKNHSASLPKTTRTGQRDRANDQRRDEELRLVDGDGASAAPAKFLGQQGERGVLF